MILDKEGLLARTRPKTEAVPVSELGDGVEIMVREMRADEVFRFHRESQKLAGEAGPDHLVLINEVLSWTIVGEDGRSLFEGSDDFARSSWLSIEVRQRLFEVVARLSGLDAGADSQKKSSTPTAASRAA